MLTKWYIVECCECSASCKINTSIFTCAYCDKKQSACVVCNEDGGICNHCNNAEFFKEQQPRTKKLIYQCLRTKNNVNGNPRRMILCYDQNNLEVVKVLKGVISNKPRGIYLVALDIEIVEYNKLVKEYDEIIVEES